MSFLYSDRIHLKVNKRKIHGSAFPQFIVAEHSKYCFGWIPRQERFL